MYVVMYHYVRKVRESRYPEIKGLELDHFRRQINFFREKGLEFISLKDMEEENKITDKSVLLTFDDGYIDHYMNVFPILEENGITGVFSMPAKILREKKVLDVNKIHYIMACTEIGQLRDRLFERMDFYRGIEFSYSSNEELYNKLAIANSYDGRDTVFVKRILQVELPEMLRNIIADELFKEFVTDNEAAFVDELYMNMDHIKMMKRHGMEFAVHGYDHYWMNHLSELELIKDITNALDVFDGIIDHKHWCCCYPYGSYSDMVIRVVKGMGAYSGLATDAAVYHPGEADIFKIPRLDTIYFPPRSDNYLNYV